MYWSVYLVQKMAQIDDRFRVSIKKWEITDIRLSSHSHILKLLKIKLHNINIIMLLILLQCQRINKNYFLGFLF